MAYTRPATGAADATWAWASAYTRPGAGVADAYFVTGITAAGFLSTTFGTPELNLNSTCMATSLSPGAAFGAPRAAFAQVTAASGFLAPTLGAPSARCIQPATGFTPLLFGTGLGYKTQRPTGFTTTQFGEPRLFPCHAVGFKPTTFGQARLFPFHVGPGFGPALFGTPVGTQHWDVASWPPVTRFGTPFITFNQTRVASGFETSHVGTPSAYSQLSGAPRALRATGVRATSFGLPVAASSVAVGADGFATATFGAHVARITQGASGAQFQAFGTPVTLFRRAASGFRQTALGVPRLNQSFPADSVGTGVRFGTPFARSTDHRATGSRLTAFGTPHSVQTFLTEGTSSTQFGAPRARTAQGASALAPASSFGHPGLTLLQAVAGVYVPHFGAPTARITQQATAVFRPTRFGLPTSERSNTYLAYGINASGRFGQPSATCRHNRPATGFRLTAFGTPACYERHRVAHLAPGTQFGTPLLKRITQC